MTTRRQLLSLPVALGASAAIGASAAPAAFAATGRNVAPRGSDHPTLDDKQLGHLRFIANIARQRHNDWSRMDSEEAGQGGFDAYRYQLAMMSYTVNLANYHYTPAYRELHQETSERLVEKMMRFDVWSFWEMTSRGAKQFDPSLAALSEGWRDPVVRQNIMYSGHLLQMVATYGMLYDSAKYEQPGALTFDYNPAARGLGRETYEYDTMKLAETLRQQFDANGYEGIECEPNAIFVECNQHPILGFKLIDHRRGTRLYDDVSAKYLKAFEAQRFLDRKTGSFMRFKFVKQNRPIPGEAAWNDGWAGIFMHGWAPDVVREVYPKLRQKYVVTQADGSAVIPFQKPNMFWSWDNGFFAALAAEVGDRETVDAMLAYADRHWAPTWVDGGLHYPRNDAFETSPGRGNGIPQRFASPRVNTLTGNALLGLARVNVAGGLLSMVDKPWTAAHFEQPFVSDIDWRSVQVARAVHDPATGVLDVRLKAAPGAKVSSAALTVRNLAATASYDVQLNGKSVGRVVEGRSASQASAVTMRAADGALALEVPMRGAMDLQIRRLG